MWFDSYKNLDLLNGKITFILDGGEDMIEISYKDGMLIDVGYIAELSSYFITVVYNDDWTKPIEEICVKDKSVLFDKIQKTIYKYRSNNVMTSKKPYGLKTKRYSKPFTVFMGIAAICMSVFFMLYSAKYDPISREEAIMFSGEFESYKETNNSKYDSKLYFKSGKYFYVSHSFDSKEFLKRMNSLEKGTTLDILVNPNINYVIEMKIGAEELLNFEESQKAIDRQNNTFFVIGIIACISGIILVILTALEHIHGKTNRDLKQARQLTGITNSPIIRCADFSVKHKILLAAKVSGYEICYRRVKSVNELIVNGYVYDEKKAVIEFEHSLFAVIDGHKIEAGLDGTSSSFICFDEKLIYYKERMI